MDDHFHPPSLLLATLGLALATFMYVLDSTIANVALPTIAGNMSVSEDQGTWIVTSFAVSQAIALPLTGFVARRFGETRVFVWCTALFVAASFACGVSTNMSMLIFFRVVQGAVCGPMYPVAQSLMISIYPPAMRGLALALISMVTVVAPVLGPILGGWITDSFSWRWIFFINIPFGLFCSFVVARQLKAKAEKTSKPKMDYIGLLTLIVGVGLLQIVLDKGGDEDWFSSTFILTATIISVITLAVFIIWELTDDDPIVDLKLFRHRNFSAGTLALVLGFACFFSMQLLIPIWLQNNLNYTATWSGIATAPIGFLPVLLVFFVGKYAPQYDLRWFASIAFIAMGVVCLLYSKSTPDINLGHIIFLQFLVGIGVTFFFMPVLTILLSDLEPADIASGSGLATFLRTLGGSLSVSIVTFLWDRRASVHHEHLTDGVTAYNPLAQRTIEQMHMDTPQQAYLQLNNIITGQSMQIAFNEVFYLMGLIFFGLFIIIWIAKPPFTAGSK